MKLKKKYKSLDDTLKHLKLQVIESVPFAEQVCPKFDNPEELFYWLKGKLKYKNDPAGTELLQTMQTMFRGHYWGVPGWGDCDCFVITTLACMIVQGWDEISIALVGRKRAAPVHIYTIIDWNGERQVFDLTNRDYNHERDTYNYIQEIFVPWTRWKNLQFKSLNEKSMYLQLAERTRVKSYTRRANKVKSHWRELSEEEEIPNPYIFVPTTDRMGRPTTVRVREDLFDDLNDVEYYRLMRDLAPYQPGAAQGLSESAFLADRASRRARRERRKADHEEKRRLKNEKKQAKNEIKKAKAESKRTGGGGKRILDTVSGVLGKVIGGGGVGIETDIDIPDDDVGPPPPEKNNTGLYVGLGIGALALGGIVYFATRKRS